MPSAWRFSKKSIWSIYGVCSSVGRAPDCGSGGRGFDPHQTPKCFNSTLVVQLTCHEQVVCWIRLLPSRLCKVQASFQLFNIIFVLCVACCYDAPIEITMWMLNVISMQNLRIKGYITSDLVVSQCPHRYFIPFCHISFPLPLYHTASVFRLEAQ